MKRNGEGCCSRHSRYLSLIVNHDPLRNRISFAGSDVVTGLDRKYKDPAVANLTGAGGFDDRLDGVVHEVLVDDEFNYDFGQLTSRHILYRDRQRGGLSDGHGPGFP